MELLKQLEKKEKIKIKDTSVPKYFSPTGRLKDKPTLGGVAKEGTVSINPNGKALLGTVAPIVNGVYRSGPTGLVDGFSPLQVFAALLIHEVRHISGDLEPETGRFAVEASILNTSEVLDACFKKPKS